MSPGCEAVSTWKICSYPRKELEDNTSVLAKALAKDMGKLSSNNHSRLCLYSTYLSTGRTSLLGWGCFFDEI
jgi:hypothetical protein